MYNSHSQNNSSVGLNSQNLICFYTSSLKKYFVLKGVCSQMKASVVARLEVLKTTLQLPLISTSCWGTHFSVQMSLAARSDKMQLYSQAGVFSHKLILSQFSELSLSQTPIGPALTVYLRYY